MAIDTQTYEPPEETYQQYRALSTAAVSSLLFGLLSVLAFLNPILDIIPLLGILMGIYALFQVRGRAHELTGNTLAGAGIGLSLFCLFGSWAALAYEYLTEVPENCTRISYRQLQPEEGVPGQKYPPFAKKLDGQRVFIKGYIFPGPKKHGIQQFLLVRDRGDCCFGGNPKITDRIQVTLKDPLRLSYNTRVRKLAGVFRVAESAHAVNADGNVYYHLEADYLK